MTVVGSEIAIEAGRLNISESPSITVTLVLIMKV